MTIPESPVQAKHQCFDMHGVTSGTQGYAIESWDRDNTDTNIRFHFITKPNQTKFCSEISRSLQFLFENFYHYNIFLTSR